MKQIFIKYKTNNFVKKKGFTAIIAVILLSTGIMAISLSATSTVVTYSDAVTKRELRIQTRMNARACLDKATLMIVKDYFINGEIQISEFGCTATIENDFNENINLNVFAKLGGVSSEGGRVLNIVNNNVKIVSDYVN